MIQGLIPKSKISCETYKNVIEIGSGLNYRGLMCRPMILHFNTPEDNGGIKGAVKSQKRNIKLFTDTRMG